MERPLTYPCRAPEVRDEPGGGKGCCKEDGQDRGPKAARGGRNPQPSGGVRRSPDQSDILLWEVSEARAWHSPDALALPGLPGARMRGLQFHWQAVPGLSRGADRQAGYAVIFGRKRDPPRLGEGGYRRADGRDRPAFRDGGS